MGPSNDSKVKASETASYAVNTDPSLSADELQLRSQGHKGELPRQFSALSLLAIAFSITNSWIGYSATFITPLFAGGGPAVIWGLLVAGAACSFITAGLAELASAFPSAGGQYHFTFMVSSNKTRPLAAFISGWLSVIAWILTTTSAAIYCAQICGNLASFWHEDYVATQWQIYLMFVLLISITAAIVIWLARAIPRGEIAFFSASLLGFFVFFVVVLATSKTKQPGSVIFTQFVNVTGWSDGTAFMIGVGSAMYAFLATDSAAHMAEEIPNPGRNVPRAMVLTMIIGIVTSGLWTIAFMFSTSDLDAVSLSALPILTVYDQALNSRAGATFFACWLLFVYFGAVISCTATTGRLVWAFARDNGLPFSGTFAKVHPTLKVPVNATIFCTVVSIVYGVIYVGSTAAFNSIIALSILSLNVTYAIPQGIALCRGRRKVLPKRPFDLGPVFGPFCNAFSVLWIALYTVLFCLPVFLPVTAINMNYVSAVVVGVVLIIVVMWFGGKRKVFTGPDVVIEGLETSS